MKVLVADQLERSGLDGLAAAGCDVIYQPALQDDGLAAALAETAAQVLVVRSTKVTAAMMDGGQLSLIVRAGAGYNTIDVAHASALGIYVSNCPGRNAVAVAELTLGLILALDRRIPDNVAELRGGKWNKKEYSKAKGLFGRTLGVLGAGSIAQEVIRRAAAFGMPVVMWSRRFNGVDREANDAERQELGLAEAPASAVLNIAPNAVTPAGSGGAPSLVCSTAMAVSAASAPGGISTWARAPSGAPPVTVPPLAPTVTAAGEFESSSSDAPPHAARAAATVASSTDTNAMRGRWRKGVCFMSLLRRGWLLLVAGDAADR